MDEVIGTVLFVNDTAMRIASDILGRPAPAELFWLAVFIVPLILAVMGRSLAAVLSVGATAWVASNIATGSPFSAQSLVLYGLCFGASLCMGGTALYARRRAEHLRARVSGLTAELQRASKTLDRERFWRRVAGDERETLPEEEVRGMWERLERTYSDRKEVA